MIDTGRVFGTKIDFGTRLHRDRVDTGAAFDDAEVEGAAWKPGGGEIIEDGDGAGERVYRIGGAVVVPAVAAWTGEDHLEAAATQSLTSDVVVAGTVEDDKRLIAKLGIAAQVAHTGEVSLPFLAYISDEDRRAGEFVK